MLSMQRELRACLCTVFFDSLPPLKQLLQLFSSDNDSAICSNHLSGILTFKVWKHPYSYKALSNQLCSVYENILSRCREDHIVISKVTPDSKPQGTRKKKKKLHFSSHDCPQQLSLYSARFQNKCLPSPQNQSQVKPNPQVTRNSLAEYTKYTGPGKVNLRQNLPCSSQRTIICEVIQHMLMGIRKNILVHR